MKGRILAAGTAAAVLAGVGTAWAAFTQEGAPYPTGAAPYTAYAADFNRDGRVDVATNNGDGQTFSVFLRQPGGGFAQEAGSPFASASSNGAIGDLNGDGYPDFVSAGFVGEGLGILIRNPAGGFTRETSPVLGGAQSAVGIGDFDGNGFGDLAVANWGFGGNVSVYLRNGAGTGFNPAPVNYASGDNPRQIAIADYNGNGLLDLAIVNSASNNVRVLLGAGGGAFTDEGLTPVGTTPNGITAGDFNRDGRADLAASNTGAGTVTVLLRNAANSGFTEGLGSPIAVGASPLQIAATDFDRNGVLDLAAASTSGLEVLLNNGVGFTRDTPTPVEGAPNGVAVGDFNADGVPDAAVSSLTTNSLTAFLSPSPPAQPTPTPTPTPAPTLDAPKAGEVNLLPAKGKVKVKLKGTSKYVDLTAGIQVKAGASVDTRKGTVTIVGPGANDEADFFDGLFQIGQSRSLTTLTLTEKLTGCKKGSKSAVTAAKKPKTRKLWGKGKGRFRTKGTYSAATVRGTEWLVQDTCTTTVTKVKQGTVTVENFATKKKLVLRKGKTYTARAKKR